ncbi:MAG: hypothetical protein Q7Q73_10045 [Verrucomicrobiota bacterium JB024]|nr:hypothetical protein [Verrucomicrobiota bacterium JB024]
MGHLNMSMLSADSNLKEKALKKFLNSDFSRLCGHQMMAIAGVVSLPNGWYFLSGNIIFSFI